MYFFSFALCVNNLDIFVVEYGEKTKGKSLGLDSGWLHGIIFHF